MKPTPFFLILLLLVWTASIFSQEFEKAYKAIASDRSENDLFGSRIAVSGNYAIVGATHDAADSLGENPVSNAGSAYLFERDYQANWKQVAKIIASERAVNDFFGSAVAICGNYAVVGTPEEDADSAGFNILNDAGSVYIYERNAYGNWRFKQRLVAEDRQIAAHFGQAVSISEDYLAVGAELESKDSAGENPVDEAGAVYLYKRYGNIGWGLVQKLVASDRSAEAYFGYSVCIHGTRLAVGAWGESYDAFGGNYLENAGAVYIFEMDLNGKWNEVEKVVASDREESASFGISVCLEDDDIFAGAPFEKKDAIGDDPLDWAGAVYVIRRGVDSHWSEIKKLVASNREEYDMFGTSVSMSGQYAIIGSSMNCKTAYILERGSDQVWEEIQLIQDTLFNNDDFLFVDIAGDYAIISSNYDHFSPAGDDSLYHAGAAYIYESCTPGSTSDPDNILENGNFEACMLSPWSLYHADYLGVTADAVLTDGECMVTNIGLADDPDIYQVQLQQVLTGSQLDRLEEGATYELTFEACSDTASRQCRVSFEQATDPWNNIFHSTIELGIAPEEYSYEFTLGSIYENMQLVFQLGNETAPATFNNVRLVKKPGVSVDDQSFEDYITIMPNPVSDVVMISTHNALAAKLYNSLGILIKNVTLIDGEALFDVSNLAKGIYYIEVRRDDKMIVEKLIIP